MTSEATVTKSEISDFIVNRISAMLAYWDNNLVCRYANKAYLEWFGKSPDEMIDKMEMQELLGPLFEKNLPYIKGALKGVKQVFEREITLPTGERRHSIATYYPDSKNGQVMGFYVHVADVTPVKVLEARLMELEKSRKREILGSVIEAQEKEREHIVLNLRESTSQTLASCMMLLQNNKSRHGDDVLYNGIVGNIQQAMKELELISKELSSTIIKDLGLLPALQDYMDFFRMEYNWIILFECIGLEVENLKMNDKVSVFRIIQNYFRLLSHYAPAKQVSVNIHCSPSEILIVLSNDNTTNVLPLQSREYQDIRNRVEYYGGTIAFRNTTGEQTLSIRLSLAG